MKSVRLFLACLICAPLSIIWFFACLFTVWCCFAAAGGATGGSNAAHGLPTVAGAKDFLIGMAVSLALTKAIPRIYNVMIGKDAKPL